ncbi:hypothetical protein PLICRDRAFT_180205 [Plicaturopsis crispa FD-325 SS-3]|uniref:Uncharacterized protein n=1 Tax=Plicaturopsis crispa FD-325 SS-3 TaxID=944288 RepID=A0A0C9T648_PLICR|nr:hypothetical protein PLICRDRAFT_180205 [Plicaturopsis crispa FD-325 SS-3]
MRDIGELPSGRADADFVQLAGNKSASWVQGYVRPPQETCEPGDKFYEWKHVVIPDEPPAAGTSGPMILSRPGSPAVTEVDSEPLAMERVQNNEGALRWTDKVVIDPLRYPWVHPPPIANWKGRTNYFEEVQMDEVSLDCSFMIYRGGKGRISSGSSAWFDRENGRVLYFDQTLMEVHGLVDPSDSEWGRPVPLIDFRSPAAPYRVYFPSRWMYRKQHPNGGTVGRVRPTPAPEELPPLAGTAPPAHDPAAVESDEDDEEMGISTKRMIYYDPAAATSPEDQDYPRGAPTPERVPDDAERLDYGTPPPLEEFRTGPTEAPPPNPQEDSRMEVSPAPGEGEPAVRLTASPSPAPSGTAQTDASMQIDPVAPPKQGASSGERSPKSWLLFHGFLPHVSFGDVERHFSHPSL